MTSARKCDNDQTQEHYYPEFQVGSFKLVKTDEYLVNYDGQWEERDFCSLGCLVEYVDHLWVLRTQEDG